MKLNADFLDLLLVLTLIEFSLCIPTVTWTLISGNGTLDRGQQLSTSNNPPNHPASLYKHSMTKDPVTGLVWLYGGTGLVLQSPSHPVEVCYAGFWTLNGTTGIWTFKPDYSYIGDVIDGTGDCASFDFPSWFPACLSGAALWAYNNSITMYGGYTNPAPLSNGEVSDVWNYVLVAGIWTWVTNIDGIDNNCMTADSVIDTMPSARQGMSTWSVNGNLYIFGGLTQTSGSSGLWPTNDVWLFNGIWHLVNAGGGAINAVNSTGHYFNQGHSNPNSFPGARSDAASWLDSNGDVWIYGGTSISNSSLGDMWKFNKKHLRWTWISGRYNSSSPVYGDIGHFRSTNTPGSRQGAASWIDSNGLLWLFGGGADYNTSYNDLWAYDTEMGQWAFASGNTTSNVPGVYSSPTPNPGSRQFMGYWSNSADEFAIFGGYANYFNSTGSPISGSLFDIWSVQISGEFVYDGY